MGRRADGILHGPEIAPGEPAAERESLSDVLLVGRLRDAIARLNPKIPADACDEALRRVLRTETPNLLENNWRFHKMLVDGIDVEYQANGRLVHDKVWLFGVAARACTRASGYDGATAELASVSLAVYIYGAK